MIAILNGKASGILKSERVALNFLGLISGVATITSKFVKKVKVSLVKYVVPENISKFKINTKIWC